MSSPYSSARLGQVAAWHRSAWFWNSGQVSAGGSRTCASTTRRRAARVARPRSAASLRSVSRPSPIRAGEQPDGRPASRGSGTGARESPTSARASSARRTIRPDRVERRGQRESPYRRGRPPGVQADEHAGRRAKPISRHPVQARAPAGPPPAQRPRPRRGQPVVQLEISSVCGTLPTTRSRRAPPGRTCPAGRPCHDHGTASSRRSTASAFRAGTCLSADGSRTSSRTPAGRRGPPPRASSRPAAGTRLPGSTR